MEQVWDKPEVQAADAKFNAALDQVPGEALRAYLLEAFEQAVKAASGQKRIARAALA